MHTARNARLRLASINLFNPRQIRIPVICIQHSDIVFQHFCKTSSAVRIYVWIAFEYARLRNSGIIPKLFMKFHRHEYILRKSFSARINKPENVLRLFAWHLLIPSNEQLHYAVNSSANGKRRSNPQHYLPRHFRHKTAYTIPFSRRWRRRWRRNMD